MRFGSLLTVFAASFLIIAPYTHDAQALFKSKGSLPLCDDHDVLDKVSDRFRSAQKHYNDGELSLEIIGEVQEIAERIAEPEETNRRFCSAKSELTNGEQPTIYYMILEKGGFASIGWGVDYCVQGHDAERAHGANCRSVRAPF